MLAALSNITRTLLRRGVASVALKGSKKEEAKGRKYCDGAADHHLDLFWIGPRSPRLPLPGDMGFSCDQDNRMRGGDLAREGEITRQHDISASVVPARRL